MFKDFKSFILRGNVMDLAIGVIIGIAFGAVVKSLVDDVIMPPIGLATGGIDFSNKFVVLKDGAAAAGPYASVAAAKAAGATTLNYGVFVNNVVSFLIIGFCAFLIVRAVNKLVHVQEPPPAPKTKSCPYCAMEIPLAATRCPNCTSQLAGAAAA
jgi:large conductance mechanosensitive channel